MQNISKIIKFDKIYYFKINKHNLIYGLSS